MNNFDYQKSLQKVRDKYNKKARFMENKHREDLLSQYEMHKNERAYMIKYYSAIIQLEREMNTTLTNTLNGLNKFFERNHINEQSNR